MRKCPKTQMHAWTKCVGLLSTLVVSCSAPATPRDSFDVPEWSLGDPVLALGSIDGDTDAFSPIRSIAVGRNGWLHILMPQEFRVAVFSEGGSPVGSIGGEGEGPGELSYPTDLGFLGDTLWVLDAWARRVNFFVDLQFVRSQPLEVPGNVHPERNARAVAMLEGGGILIVTDSQSPYDPTVTTEPSLILVQHSESLDTLATYSTDYTAGFIIRRSGGAISAVRPFPQPFSGGDNWAFSPDGGHVVLVKSDPIQPDQPAPRFSVTMFRAAGDTVFSRQFPYEPVPMPDEVRKRTEAVLAGDMFTVEEVREAAYLPETFPPVSGALIADDGSVWIGREAIPDSPRRWDILSAVGELVASLTTPSGFDLKAVAHDDVWGIVQDELDVPYVLRRPIVRPPTG